MSQEQNQFPNWRATRNFSFEQTTVYPLKLLYLRLEIDSKVELVIRELLSHELPGKMKAISAEILNLQLADERFAGQRQEGSRVAFPQYLSRNMLISTVTNWAF